MGSSTGVRHERQEVSSTVSPRVESSNPVSFLLNFFSLIQFWHRCQNDLFKGKLDYLHITCIVIENSNTKYKIRFFVFVTAIWTHKYIDVLDFIYSTKIMSSNRNHAKSGSNRYKTDFYLVFALPLQGRIQDSP